MMKKKEISNSELFYQIKRTALMSVYWGRKTSLYHLVEVYGYAPMIEDELFNSLFEQKAIVGAYDIEAALGRKIAIEELIVCPLSVNYLIFGEPLLTGSEKEREKLLAFKETVENGIRRNERRAINREIKRLNGL